MTLFDDPLVSEESDPNTCGQCGGQAGGDYIDKGPVKWMVRDIKAVHYDTGTIYRCEYCRKHSGIDVTAIKRRF